MNSLHQEAAGNRTTLNTLANQIFKGIYISTLMQQKLVTYLSSSNFVIEVLA